MTLAGPRPLPLVLLFLGAGLALVGLADYPRYSRFYSGGIERVCRLRRHHLDWEVIDSLKRARGSRLAAVSMPRFLGGVPPAERLPRPAAFGGLVAVGGRRHYLLVDQVESRGEFDRLSSLLLEWAPHVRIRATRPPEAAVPSDLYRRRP